MALNTGRARELLAKGDLRALFIEELGWDRHTASLEVTADGSRLSLHAVAQKRGMVVYECPTPAGQRLPDHAQRRKIEHQVAKSVHEHLIVFTDGARGLQVWQWVRRKPGRPAACREHTYHRSQPGDALLQKLSAVAFTLEEEERLSLPDVTGRARAGFDVERVTKQFYDRFQKEHAAFLDFITGITERSDREWYASVMLNRLMFVYFIQRKGFLDGDRDYLRNRLRRMRSEYGKDKFYSFYRYFLLRLFHEGLGGTQHTEELERLLGRIPYLNGGLFDVHELERSDRYGAAIRIPDRAFERVFDYFDQYQWHLDERPRRADNEINPDVLGYIFEKYVNQKQMGAYYTKEDITEYIARSTVLPFLLEAVRHRYPLAFDGVSSAVWHLLKEEPERYVYPALRHGVDAPLPEDVAAGFGPPTLGHRVGPPASLSDIQTLSLRKDWNRPAPPSHALPTETWREVIARHGRYEEVRAKLGAGEVRSVNDLIALNLDVRQLVQDAVENCEDPAFLRAFWITVREMTILDPTCGSGAFLFAALNVLEPLYEAILDRMEAFVQDSGDSEGTTGPKECSDFQKVLDEIAEHPNRRYFVLKSIILNNLFGVDLMEEAVEICKLRLFLKLAAQVEPEPTKPNLGIEPLPDVDFNIRAGNTLVGFASYEEVLAHAEGDFIREQEMEKVRSRAADLQRAFDRFRARQVEGIDSASSVEKQEIRARLQHLAEELNHYLAREYGVELQKKGAFASWLASHTPFHWFVEFHEISSRGGFDVIIGNPPYVELSDLSGQYEVRGLTLVGTGNLYAVCLERFVRLLRPGGRMGVIVPISAVSTPRMLPLMQFLHQQLGLFASNYAVRPSKLFVGVDMNLTILVANKEANPQAPRQLFSTSYLRWNEEARPYLFSLLSYAPCYLMSDLSSVPKVGSRLEGALFQKIAHHPKLGAIEAKHGSDVVYYHSGGRYFRKCLRRRLSNEYKELRLQAGWGDIVLCLMSSSFYYWLWIQLSDCYHVTRRDVALIPVPASLAKAGDFKNLASRLLDDLEHHATRRTRRRADGTVQEEINYHVGQSIGILNEIDVALASHYDLSEAELDFIMSYDVKYRLSGDSQNNG